MSHHDPERSLTRTDASNAVASIGWRYLLGILCASVPVAGLEQAVRVADTAVRASGPDADAHLRVDLRHDRVELSLQTRATGTITARDTALAHAITHEVSALGLWVAPARAAEYPRPVAMLEVAIDALDIAAVRPFWKAALALVDDPADSGPAAALIDPAGQLPAVWFQQMAEPRPQRNRIHLDVTVGDDEAEARVEAVLAAGGRMVDDSFARMFWVLADAEGNECCICTWTDRDEWDANE